MELQVSTKALAVINLINKAIGAGMTGVSFVSIRNYTNSNGEVANHLINVGASYANAKKADIEFLESINLSAYDFKSDKSLLEQARLELIAAFHNPSETRSNGQKDAYTGILDGLKVHNESGKVYIYGYRERKTVQIEGTYPSVNSKPLTIAKNELRKLLKTGKFTQYALEVGNEIRANKETLEL